MFQTLDGLKILSLSVDQMREVDRIAMEETGPSMLQMMENAGSVLAEFTCEQWPRGVRVGPVIVLAGGGHNGGGGICAAYHLLCQGGNVRVCLGGDEPRLKKATAKQLARFRAAGGLVVGASEVLDSSPFLVIDALIGYGLHGAVPYGLIAELIHWANVCSAPVLSLDVPSGLNADTGELSHDTASHPCIRAAKTLTLALPKRGLVAACVGELWLADIGIPGTVFQKLGLDVQPPFAGTAKIRLNIREDSPVFPGSPFG
ncbi:MAG: NAD(P)H-hydrate epimerase [Mariprofundaceae bacterium]|nr:NAD(P)H-hydrate epimerase [Mariprofundaceae bacterium]